MFTVLLCIIYQCMLYQRQSFCLIIFQKNLIQLAEILLKRNSTFSFHVSFKKPPWKSVRGFTIDCKLIFYNDMIISMYVQVTDIFKLTSMNGHFFKLCLSFSGILLDFISHQDSGQVNEAGFHVTLTLPWHGSF